MKAAFPILTVLLTSCATTNSAISQTQNLVSADQAAAAYERFKQLDGTWKGQSTRGWTDQSVWKTIAAQSAVMYTTFDAHPNETMVTFIHPDQDRLLITHYCVAGNQPRYVLSNVENEGRRLTFEFLDATNLKSRDHGHMDKAVFEFLDDGSFTTRWTWYQKGQEQWMEEIRNFRVTESEAPAADGPSVTQHH